MAIEYVLCQKCGYIIGNLAGKVFFCPVCGAQCHATTLTNQQYDDMSEEEFDAYRESVLPAPVDPEMKAKRVAWEEHNRRRYAIPPRKDWKKTRYWLEHNMMDEYNAYIAVLRADPEYEPQPSRTPAKPATPECPYCKSGNTTKISTAGKIAKVGFFGLFGLIDSDKQWKCNNCGSKF